MEDLMYAMVISWWSISGVLRISKLPNILRYTWHIRTWKRSKFSLLLNYYIACGLWDSKARSHVGMSSMHFLYQVHDQYLDPSHNYPLTSQRRDSAITSPGVTSFGVTSSAVTCCSTSPPHKTFQGARKIHSHYWSLRVACNRLEKSRHIIKSRLEQKCSPILDLLTVSFDHYA